MGQPRVIQERRPDCPICRRPSTAEFRPFCSQRCADVDLGRWLNERYAIPEDIDSDEAPREPDPER
ncbi:DNA gyrase inhibitor YacG [Methylobacterium sp. NEAU K]|uniref:DNA gyrase inhibitor YacG n=1 Tax=Methylobacterium sp. NEAU K TaxID=3064946 RepID=UPI0027365A4E|nr:DNA gyrase inhibitor YacG [Methylobacterium sp. NEAU K]MDP4005595.1 DNA gyrase inhibitor YacG [Methylobacterium sp. NEAU K]